ncbi:Aste57867_13434 [Aphanomyces stellatus]|uniref:Aste57867_13434 protein n=1 Tax=Aphanomyces stellatus TaxID=120398 RepID=A0A485KYD5_9STRA|nr:hypothetical protein As57867_013384 [Aphanomyces stellatus]VFT90273.1 Aste57867_13434 [Aphanomyces stellatus]
MASIAPFSPHQVATPVHPLPQEDQRLATSPPPHRRHRLSSADEFLPVHHHHHHSRPHHHQVLDVNLALHSTMRATKGIERRVATSTRAAAPVSPTTTSTL